MSHPTVSDLESFFLSFYTCMCRRRLLQVPGAGLLGHKQDVH